MFDRIGDQKQGLLDFINDLPDNIVLVEIGCYAGGSTELFLKSGKIKKMYCVDPWMNGFNPQDIEHNNSVEDAEKVFDSRITSKFENVVKLKMKSNECLEHITEKIDVVYIDGDHTYQACSNDIKIAKILLLQNKDGLISGHDINMESVQQAVRDSNLTLKKCYLDYSWTVFN